MNCGGNDTGIHPQGGSVLISSFFFGGGEGVKVTGFFTKKALIERIHGALFWANLQSYFTLYIFEEFVLILKQYTSGRLEQLICIS